MSGVRLDVLVAGELNPDAIVVADDVEPEYGQVERLVHGGVLTVGSSGAIVACGTARLGMRTGYVGVVGDDASGRFLLQELGRRDVDVELCRTDPDRGTGLTIVITRADDRAILTYPGAMAGLEAADVTDEMLASTERLHVSSPHLQSGLRAGLAGLFRRAHEAGVSTSLDPGWDPSGSWGPDIADALEETDVFVPNAVEACKLAGADDPEAALAVLAERIETVAVTLGSDGAIARRRGETAAVSALAIEAVDATGAGDNFTAGLLHGLGGGQTLEGALRLAVACGSLSTRRIGGVDAQPRLDEALELAATLRPREIERSA